MSGMFGRSTLWDPGGFMQGKYGDPLGINNKLADKAEKKTPGWMQNLQKKDPFTTHSLDTYSQSQLYGVKGKQKQQSMASNDVLGAGTGGTAGSMNRG
jgi:hypothetical protein